MLMNKKRQKKQHMRLLLSFLLIFLINSYCNQTGQVFAYDNDFNNACLYKITKIKELKRCYLIYAQRNDSAFKIISDKKICLVKAEKIMINRGYSLKLTKAFPLDSLLGFAVMPNHVTGLVVKGGDVVYIDDETHNVLYVSHNLIGLKIIDK